MTAKESTTYNHRITWENNFLKHVVLFNALYFYFGFFNFSTFWFRNTVFRSTPRNLRQTSTTTTWSIWSPHSSAGANWHGHLSSPKIVLPVQHQLLGQHCPLLNKGDVNKTKKAAPKTYRHLKPHRNVTWCCFFSQVSLKGEKWIIVAFSVDILNR